MIGICLAVPLPTMSAGTAVMWGLDWARVSGLGHSHGWCLRAVAGGLGSVAHGSGWAFLPLSVCLSLSLRVSPSPRVLSIWSPQPRETKFLTHWLQISPKHKIVTFHGFLRLRPRTASASLLPHFIA